MEEAKWLWPTVDMDLWKINNSDYAIRINWSKNYFEDYKKLSFDFYKCGYSTFCETIESIHDNVKSDMWFLTGIFLLRQSMELGLKALICKVFKKNIEIQSTFETCCHNLSLLFKTYTESSDRVFLSEDEKLWLLRYLCSLEVVDGKSDMFRFPFSDMFLSQFRDKFLDNVDVANNMLQAYTLIKKCMNEGVVENEDEFDGSLKPEFFVFATHGIGNCYLWQGLSDNGFHVKVTGYIEVIDYIFHNQEINLNDKFYPLMFMYRNTLELCLKRLFYSRVDNGVSKQVFFSKRKSHLIKKDLWKNVKPVILYYANEQNQEVIIVDIVEKQLDIVNSLDKNGDIFRYPTSYSLEYRFNNTTMDLKNVYEYFRAIINFLDGCDSMLDAVADYQDEIQSEYESEMCANMDWY